MKTLNEANKKTFTVLRRNKRTGTPITEDIQAYTKKQAINIAKWHDNYQNVKWTEAYKVFENA